MSESSERRFEKVRTGRGACTFKVSIGPIRVADRKIRVMWGKAGNAGSGLYVTQIPVEATHGKLFALS
jgi:hypothetical protein